MVSVNTDLDTVHDPEALRERARQALAEIAALRRDKAKLEAEVALLLARIAEVTRQLAAATDRDAQLALELQLKVVQEQLSTLNHEKFGPSRSERRERPEASKGESDTKKPRKTQTGHGPTPQPQLPGIDVLHLLDDADCVCPSCGDPLDAMHGHYEESDTISVERVKYLVKHHKRQKYRCGGCGHIDTAPGPTKLIPGGRYDDAFVVQVATDKYSDHIPLENQVDRMAREGLVVTSQALFDQLWAAAMILLPTWLANKKRVLAQDRVHVDETPWRMIGKGPSQRWWVWTVTNAAGTHFDILPTRGAMGARKVLDGYDGVVVADGYGVYAALEGALDAQGGVQTALDGTTLPLPNFQLAGCWSHARRPFVKSEGYVPEARVLLDLVARLYAIEAEAEDLAGGDEDALLEHRSRLRNEKSRPVIAEIEAWRARQRPLPGTKFARGLTYLANQRGPLTLFLDDPDIPLDNNAAERAIRCPVRGRKAHLGSHSVRGTQVAAVFYSLLGSCRQVGVNPQTWMLAALRRALARPGTVTLPHDFAAEQVSAD